MHTSLTVFPWMLFSLGILSGAASGLFFHRKDWLGGYDSWSRRMIRLGHIAWFGMGFFVTAWLVTIRLLLSPSGFAMPAWMPLSLVTGAMLMPTLCYLSARWQAFRFGFVLPVLCLLAVCLSIVLAMLA